MMAKIIVVAADHRRADEHRLGRRLERVAGRVVRLEVVLALLEVRREAEVALDLLLDARLALRLRQLEDRLGVVRHRAVAVDRDVHRAHAEEAERDHAERERRRVGAQDACSANMLTK